MKISATILTVFSVVFWVSAAVLFYVGLTYKDLSILRWLAIPDALVAAVLTWFTVQRWTVQ